MSAQVEERGQRWLARSRTGILVSAASFAIPIVLSIVATFSASKLLPHPVSNVWRVLWWASILAIAWVAAIVGERLARPLLPLASLLKMSLLFPDRAPSRFAVAWRSGSTRQLDRYVHGTDTVAHREPITAAVEILTLVTALSSHDRRTRGHSERVRVYTDLLAEQLHLPAADKDRLRWSALLHDVGKIHVHVDILNKEGTPSEHEWEILRRHPREGQRMIEPLREWLGEWGLAVEQHHENFDGTGYPEGLSGNQISLGARIVSVADAFEVMTAPRSYKSPMSPAAARKELTRCAGTQFDPAIVRAFLDISVGRQRLVIGPLAWLFDVPIISQFSNLGSVVAAGSQVAVVASSVLLSAAAVGGQDALHPLTQPHHVVAVASRVKHQPTVVTDLSSRSLKLGARVHGTATIANAVPDASGSVTYRVYRNDTCLSSGLVATLGSVKVSSGRVPGSSNWTTRGPAGTYYFVADYSGDASDDASQSGCGADPLVIGRGVTSISTRLSATTVAIGGEVDAGAAIIGSRHGAGGTVMYDVFNNDACSNADGGLVAELGPMTVTNGVAPNSPNWAASEPAGTYYFVAVYSGDASHKAAISTCGGAPLTVASAALVSTVSKESANPNPTPAPTTTTTAPAPTTTTTAIPPTTTTTAKPPTTTTTDPPTTTTTDPPTTTTTDPPPTTTTTAKPPPTTTTTAIFCPWWKPGCLFQPYTHSSK